MKKKKKNLLSQEDEIDYVTIIDFLKKNLLVFTLVIFTSITASYLYYKNLDQFVKNTVTIKFPPISEFERFYLTEFDDNALYHYNKFVIGLDIHLISKDSFKDFLLTNKSKFSIQNVENYSMQYEGKKVFSDSGIVLSKSSNPTYINDLIGKEFSIKYKYGSNGREILTSYIEYAKKKALNDFNKEAISNINMHIAKLNNDLDIAIDLGIERPYNTTIDEKNFLPRSFDYNNSGFFLGSQVITRKIDQLELKKINIVENNFDFHIFLSTTKHEKFLRKKITNYLISGLIVGLVLSLIIIFFRPLVVKN